MQTLLVEQPWMIGAMGSFLSLVTFFGWIQTGNSIAFKTACGLVATTILLVLLNIWVVSDREIVHQWLIETADEVQNNQIEKVLNRIHPESSDRVENSAAQLKVITFSALRITRIHSIEIQTKRQQKKALVRMNVFAEGSIRGFEGKHPRWIGLTLEQVGKEWLVTDIEEREPQHEFMNATEDSLLSNLRTGQR